MDTVLLDQLPVLSDTIRARLLALLDRQELTVGEMCDVLQLPQSTVSRHLKTLADAGWVVSRREGTSRFYEVAHDDLAPGLRKLWRLVREDVEGSAAAGEDERRLKICSHAVARVPRSFFQRPPEGGIACARSSSGPRATSARCSDGWTTIGSSAIWVAVPGR